MQGLAVEADQVDYLVRGAIHQKSFWSFVEANRRASHSVNDFAVSMSVKSLLLKKDVAF
jgi:hypothetical protein